MKIPTSLILLILLSVSSSQAQTMETCSQMEKYRPLDFWVGDWKVYVGDELVGTNRIEKILNGCAILEHWKDIRGREGKSLFYFDLVSQNWKQVWVTDAGSMKEKTLRSTGPDGSVLFQGEVTTLQGQKILDRTTLFPLKEEVRQLIEQSTDNGKTWSAVFDSIYKKN